jgi:hypothetical protein
MFLSYPSVLGRAMAMYSKIEVLECIVAWAFVPEVFPLILLKSWSYAVISDRDAISSYVVGDLMSSSLHAANVLSQLYTRQPVQHMHMCDLHTKFAPYTRTFSCVWSKFGVWVTLLFLQWSIYLCPLHDPTENVMKGFVGCHSVWEEIPPEQAALVIEMLHKLQAWSWPGNAVPRHFLYDVRQKIMQRSLKCHSISFQELTWWKFCPEFRCCTEHPYVHNAKG